MRKSYYTLLLIAVSCIQISKAAVQNYTVEETRAFAIDGNGSDRFGSGLGGGNSGYLYDPDSPLSSGSHQYNHNAGYSSLSLDWVWSYGTNSEGSSVLKVAGVTEVSSTFRVGEQLSAPNARSDIRFTASFDLTEDTWVRFDYDIQGFGGGEGVGSYMHISVGGKFRYSGGEALDGQQYFEQGVFGDPPILAPSGSIFLLSAGHHSVSIESFVNSEGGPALSGSYDFTLTMGPAVPEPSTWMLLGLGGLFASFCVMRRRAD